MSRTRIYPYSLSHAIKPSRKLTRCSLAAHRAAVFTFPFHPCVRHFSSGMASTGQGQGAPARRLQNPAIFICDIQEKFRPAIWEFDKVISTTHKLLRAALALRIPVFVTTQNRARLGPTVSELTDGKNGKEEPGPLRALADAGLLLADADKTRFSMWVNPIAQHPLFTSPTSLGQKQVAIVGIETHICVTQTALDLLARGDVAVYVLADGVSSCNAGEVGVALARLRAAGAVVTTSESWLYEVMGDAGVAEFRAVVGLVKETAGDTRAAVEALLGGGGNGGGSKI